jgi:hypothetical protein
LQCDGRAEKLTLISHESDLSARLNLSPDEGEKWIVNLIRDTRMAADAKIDLEKVTRSFMALPSAVIIPFDLTNTTAECHRDSPPGTTNIPVGHRKDAWAEHPNAGARRRTQSDWAAAGTAFPGAIGGRC